MYRRRLLLALALAGSMSLFWPGRSVPLEMQSALYGRLLDAAGIIFTVMGIWVALLYPQARDAIFKLRRVETPEEKRVQELLRPMLIATAVLGIVLLHGPAAEVVRGIPRAHRYVNEFRGCSFALLGGLTLFLFWSVLQTLLPMLYVREDLTELRKRQDRLAGLKQTG